MDIKKVEEKIEYLSSDPKTLELYKARERSLHERANMISSAKEEGIEDAKNLLKLGVSIDIIIKAIGLSEEQIMQIKKELVYMELTDMDVDKTMKYGFINTAEFNRGIKNVNKYNDFADIKDGYLPIAPC